jgi:hypothetical protein
VDADRIASHGNTRLSSYSFQAGDFQLQRRQILAAPRGEHRLTKATAASGQGSTQARQDFVHQLRVSNSAAVGSASSGRKAKRLTEEGA